MLRIIKAKDPQTIAIPGLISRKVMPCDWWKWKGISREFLQPGHMIQSDILMATSDKIRVVFIRVKKAEAPQTIATLGLTARKVVR